MINSPVSTEQPPSPVCWYESGRGTCDASIYGETGLGLQALSVLETLVAISCRLVSRGQDSKDGLDLARGLD